MANGEIVVNNVTDNPVGRLVYSFKLRGGLKVNNNFYVYEWYNINTGYVFYVGKGSNGRYKLSTKSVRNKQFLNYKNKYNCDVRIIYSNLKEDEAFKLEIDTITKYKLIDQCNCNYTNGGEGISGYTHSESARKAISETHKGEQNSQFGISPKERMGDKYDDWLNKVSKDKVGSSNPNYNNDTLKLKYKENPELALEKQSRKGNQNGRAIKIQLYDNNMNFIKEFDYIGLCCEYLHNNYGFSSNPEVIRIGIRKSIKFDTPYKGFKFIKL